VTGKPIECLSSLPADMRTLLEALATLERAR
jgi:hypothetical protein